MTHASGKAVAPIYQSIPEVTGDAGAIFSDCGRYRYLLWRSWLRTDLLPNLAGVWATEQRWLLFIGLNPSYANAERSDVTVSQMVGRAKRLGCSGLLVANSHALVSTDPQGLKQAGDPVGPENRIWVERAVRMAHVIVPAWGNLGGSSGMDIRTIIRLSKKRPLVLGLTGEGNPRHPRGVSLGVQLQEWNRV